MSFLGLGHIRHFTDDEWPAVRAALQAANIDPGTGAMFTATQKAVADLLTNDPLVQLAKKAIQDANASGLSNGEKLAKAAGDIVPALAAFLASGGIQAEAAKMTGLGFTFIQEVHNLFYSSTIKDAVRQVDEVFAAKK